MEANTHQASTDAGNGLEPEQDKPKARGEFFAACVDTIRDIVRQGGTAEQISCFIVLARHTQGRGNWQYRASTAGAKALADKAGVTHRRATKELTWLNKNAAPDKEPFIQTRDEILTIAEHPISEYLGKGQSRQTKIRWVLRELSEDDDRKVYLSHTLIDGIGQGKNKPPLSRIIEQTPLPKHTWDIKSAKLDSIMVLLLMYQHHDLKDSGGVDPRAGLYREWEHTGLSELLDSAKEFDLLPFTLQEIKRGDQFVFNSFAKEALFYIEDEEERHRRFWFAFNNLNKLGFFYEVVEIWDSNPLKQDDAELLYPLYIFDSYGRKNDPFVAKDIHSALIDCSALEGMAVREFFDEIEVNRIAPKQYQQCRYVVTTTGGYPLSVFRLRFRPATRDTGRGMEAEELRADSWKEIIRDAGHRKAREYH
jgi:hypothetical protein